MSNKINQIQGIHSEVTNIIDVLNNESKPNVRDYYLTQMNNLCKKLIEVTGDEPGITIDENYCYDAGNRYCDKNYLLLLAKNIKSWIEDRHHISSDRGQLIGTLGKVIHNNKLRQRCFDILANPRLEKDSVVREASLVFVDVIKTRIGVLREDQIEWDKVSQKLIVYEEKKDNDSFFELVKFFRNVFSKQSRHELVEGLSEGEAIKILAFIDLLVAKIEKARVKT